MLNKILLRIDGDEQKMTDNEVQGMRVMNCRFLFFLSAALFCLEPGSARSETLKQPANVTDRANVARAERLISEATALVPIIEPQRSTAQQQIASFYLDAGRCKDAMRMLAGQKPGAWFGQQRMVTAARRGNDPACTAALVRQWALDARNGRKISQLAEAGAALRVTGNDAEGRALITEAEAQASSREPLTRTSYLWSLRLQELLIYQHTALFRPEIDRTTREFLAAPPSTDTRIVQPMGGQFARLLFEEGKAEQAKSISEAVCAASGTATISCGTGGYYDTDLDRLTRQLASGTPAEQLAATGALYSKGRIDLIVPQFGRMVEIHGGNRLKAFRFLTFYAYTLWPAHSADAERGARAALALGIGQSDKAQGLDDTVWHFSNQQLAEIFASAGDARSVQEVLRRGRPVGKVMDTYQAAIASGYARFGNDAAMLRHVQAIADRQARRRAWWRIATLTPGVAIERRLQAAERALAIPYVKDPDYTPPLVEGLVCGELPGGAMIASEGAAVEALVQLAEVSRRREEAVQPTCAYRRFLLDAAKGAGSDDRAKTLARKLQLTAEPCFHSYCADYGLLELLIGLRMFDEAEQLVRKAQADERIWPFVAIARGLITAGGSDVTSTHNSFP